MPRTPLLRKFQVLFEDFEEAERSGRTVEAVQEERSLMRLTRRDFLKATGVTVGAAALGGPVAAMAAIRPKPGGTSRIAIIGGGIAGLNAALTLQDAGIASTVYEASPRWGGRMHSDTTSWNGQTSEHCGELIDSKHKTILGLTTRFKLPTVDLLAAEPNQSTETDFFFGGYYTTTQENVDFNPVWNAVKKDLTSAPFPTLYNSFNQAGFDLDHLSLFDWIETRVPGGHTSRMGQLLDVAYNIEYGNVTTEQSSLNMVYLLGFQPQPGQFRIFGASDERYHIAGGNERLPQAIAAALPAASLNLNTALTGIVRNADGSWTLSLNGPSGKFTSVVDRVIMAIPFSVLRTLLTSDRDYRAAGFDTIKQIAIQQLGYGKNCKLQLQFNSRLWNQQGPWGLGNGSTYSDTGYQNTWDVTRAQDGSTGILVDYTGGGVPLASFSGNPTDPKVVAGFAKTFLSQIEPVFPGITKQWNGIATLDVPLTNPFLLGSYSYWKVGQYTQFSGYEGLRQPDIHTGKCHFAGEHCSTNFQGFMEGGAEEGARAANEILDDFKNGVFP
ncbi:MAG: twin-arginine translocation signal domain-containing protein [Chloroflexi bacterium]|nr:MAG: twin-arginine translocation signal domain-containing protein [Chloroflexota bacterium]